MIIEVRVLLAVQPLLEFSDFAGCQPPIGWHVAEVCQDTNGMRVDLEERSSVAVFCVTAGAKAQCHWLAGFRRRRVLRKMEFRPWLRGNVLTKRCGELRVKDKIFTSRMNCQRARGMTFVATRAFEIHLGIADVSVKVEGWIRRHILHD